MMTGCWPSSPSAKNPTTVEPGKRFGFSIMPDVPALVTEFKTVAIGKSITGNNSVLAVCQPNILTLYLPVLVKSALDSIIPVHQTQSGIFNLL